MAQQHHTPEPASLEDAVTALFCVVDDAYPRINSHSYHYASLKRLSDSEVLTLALIQQLRGVESCRSFLRDAGRFLHELFPGVVGLHPSSFHRRVRKLGRYLEPLRRTVLEELVGEPETLLVDSTLIEVLHPRQVSQSTGVEGAGWVRWGSFSVYGVKLHMICATNRVPISYEITAANIADISLTEELVGESGLTDEVVRRLFGDLAYESGPLSHSLAEGEIALVTRRANQRGVRQQIEIAFANLKGVFCLGQTLATTLTGIVMRIVAKVTAYTFGFYINRMLGRPQGKIKELWA
jgi:hypothetical protein